MLNSVMESKLSDEKCLVVQFINERHKPVQVGFQAWLKEENNTTSDLSHLLNSEVIIRWPKGEDIKCARMMEKMIKKKNIIWEDLVVRVRSLGIFTDMCQHVKNIELFGMPNPSREERRVLCHKPSSSNQSHMLNLNSSEHDSESDESSKKRKKIEPSNVEKTQPLLQLHIEQKKRKKTEPSNVGNTQALLQSQIENLSPNFVKKSSQIDLISSDDENDEDNSMFKWTKIKLIDLINTLKMNNKKLTQDNARLRALRTINEDLHKMTGISSTLFKDMDRLRSNIDSLCIKTSENNKTNASSDNTNNNEEPSYSNKNEQKENNINNNGSTLEVVKIQGENSSSQQILSIVDIKQPAEQSLDEPTIAMIEDITDFAGRHVQTEKLKRLSRSKLSLFTASVMDLVFRYEEMANSSMTGLTSNFSRGKSKFHIEDMKAKPELNPQVKKAVMEYILNEFDCPKEGPLNKAAIAEIFKAMKSKLNNKSNTWRNKKNNQEKSGTSN